MQLAVIVAIVIAIASVAFAMQNSVPATVVFLFWRFDGSLAMILLLALALGAVVVALVSTPATLRAKWVINGQRREIDSLKAVNAELRARAAERELQSVTGRSGEAPDAQPDAGGPAGLKSVAARLGTSRRETEPKA
ncbi:MAG: lipopolysaccharide assembly protein LapA domain-containing protein [Burkholderiales bacterium]